MSRNLLGEVAFNGDNRIGLILHGPWEGEEVKVYSGIHISRSLFGQTWTSMEPKCIGRLNDWIGEID